MEGNILYKDREVEVKHYTGGDFFLVLRSNPKVTIRVSPNGDSFIVTAANAVMEPGGFNGLSAIYVHER